MMEPNPTEGARNGRSFRIVRRDVSAEEVASMGFGKIALEMGCPALPQGLAEMHNRFFEALVNDMTNILQKRQTGEMSDEEYAFWKTCYPDLP